MNTTLSTSLSSAEPRPSGTAAGSARSAQGPGLLPRGHVLAQRYQIDEPLGRGAQGVVYAALDLRSDQSVAVKLRARTPASDERRSSPLLAQLRHPLLQRVLAWGQDGGLDYLVFPRYCGRDLEALVRASGSLTPRRTRRLGLQLLKVLSYLHARGVIHRDVKPSNVLLAYQRPVLIDFELATRLDAPTRARKLVGTPLFMSRERLSGRPAVPSDDLYACALTLYELTSGALPTAPSAPRNLDELWTARARPLAPTGPLDPFFARALALDPGQRFASARSAAVALSACGAA